MATLFEKELSRLINVHSCENDSDTPNFILAAYLSDCLAAYNRATQWSVKWHSPKGVPKSEQQNGPTIERR
jgi:hypothetical protein